MKIILIMASSILVVACTLIIIDGSQDVKINTLTENDTGLKP